MRGLSSNVNLDFLLGLELQQVCVGIHQVILNFSSATSIAIESEYRLNDAPSAPATLCSLLGRSVERVSNTGDGSFLLVFTKGYQLRVLDSNEEYESYQITSPGVQIIV